MPGVGTLRSRGCSMIRHCDLFNCCVLVITEHKIICCICFKVSTEEKETIFWPPPRQTPPIPRSLWSHSAHSQSLSIWIFPRSIIITQPSVSRLFIDVVVCIGIFFHFYGRLIFLAVYAFCPPFTGWWSMGWFAAFLTWKEHAVNIHEEAFCRACIFWIPWAVPSRGFVVPHGD